MEHPKTVGDCTTLAVMLALRSNGYDISVPFGENTRYDLILDDGTRLRRIQCKTGRLRAGAIRFATASSYYHHPNEKPTQRHSVARSTTSPSIVERQGRVFGTHREAARRRSIASGHAGSEWSTEAHSLRVRLRDRSYSLRRFGGGITGGSGSVTRDEYARTGCRNDRFSMISIWYSWRGDTFIG
jgi:PD-(D/E)XK endonuclease